MKSKQPFAGIAETEKVAPPAPETCVSDVNAAPRSCLVDAWFKLDACSPASSKSKKKCEIVCLCNCVSRETIESAIRAGAGTLNQIFDETCAGVGPCGGSCRRKLQPMIDAYKSSGCFPEKLASDQHGKIKQKR